MKAKLKNGLVVDVRVYMLNSGLGDSRTLYMDNDRGITYYEDELEFIPDEKNQMISLAQLRDILENRIPPYSDPKYVVAEVNLIIEQIKEDLK